MNVCIIGSGHVGLVTGACLADLGNKVICMDDDKGKIKRLKEGVIPFYEPELEALVHRNVDGGRLSFTTSVEEGVRGAEVVFICVGTPQGPDGAADLSYVEAASKRIAEAMDGYKAIVDKSTVPVKTGSWVKKMVKLYNRQSHDFDVISNPEFLREGKAVYDFMHPDRIVIGVESERAAEIMLELYRPLEAPKIITNIETAELIKHASNAFLALKISYINAIANICEAVGADVTKVAEGMGYDRRIGRDFLDAGIGYGGYCLPKDVAAFIKIAEEVGYDFELLKAVEKINAHQVRQVIRKAKNLLWNLSGKTIGILGLAFKPNTDDIREAPSINIIRQLQQEGVRIKAYDPQAMENIRPIFPDIELCLDPYQVAEGSDGLIIVTEWDEFKNLDLPRVKELLNQPVIIDGRNIFEPAQMEKLGFMYQGVGR
ncbi:MAG TPA: UDP-glucose/GDP-mannose dehydrogenase family protein [Dehalococcoidia bacterium]|nr:UDP-glucose/GDP-mannose dehydrogenase family protein [Dehalococcoidia bacterium]